MLVLDALFDHFQQISSNVEIIRSLVQCFPISAIDVRIGSCVTSIAGPTALRNCTRDEGGPFEVGNQVLISSHRKLLSTKAMVLNVAETSGLDSDR